jgi:Tfp pilus assembly protein PilZ
MDNNDRRSALRLRQEERAVVRPVDAEESFSHAALYCSTIDISPSGIQIRSVASIPPGARVNIAIMLEGLNQVFYLAGKVKWCARLQDAENHTLGIEFQENDISDMTSWRRIFN